MKQTVFPCFHCGQKNRLPELSIVEKARCGTCKRLVIHGLGSSKVCLICIKPASNAVGLSNGHVVHSSCLDGLHASLAATELEVARKRTEISRIAERINSLAYRLSQVLRLSADDGRMAQQQSKLDVELNDLLSRHRLLVDRLTSVYDFFLTYPPDWNRRRILLIDEGGERCKKCGATQGLHVHHIQRLSFGGSNELSNLVLLCERCHSEEHGGRDFSGEFSHAETGFSKRSAKIHAAIEGGKRVEFLYRKPDEERFRKRVIRPVRLESVPHQHGSGFTLCVVGHCELRKAERKFALARMKSLRVI